ncbi:ATPase [Vibrio europaeus]|uniref:ATPase n=2 Tax=Vibrio europaeus TaxID=300876 RepID=A0AAE7AYL3_9VIBR|nr:ATPase [Vibrio europaeus]
MRWIVISVLAILSAACSQVVTTNSSVIEQLEERLEFNSTQGDDSMARAVAFIQDVKRREPKARFLVEYKTGSSDFVAKLHDQFKTQGVAKDRYKVALASPNQENILITAQYVQIKSSDCGAMTFSKREAYRFGCSVEHNRNISLVNPITRVQ